MWLPALPFLSDVGSVGSLFLPFHPGIRYFGQEVSVLGVFIGVFRLVLAFFTLRLMPVEKEDVFSISDVIVKFLD